MNTSEEFAYKSRKYQAFLSEIETTTKSIQQQGRTLSNCRVDIHTLFLAVLEER